MNKNKQLVLALVLGFVALAGNHFYLESVRDDLAPKEYKKVIRAGDKQILAGTIIKASHLKSATVPKKYLPKAAIGFADRDALIGQEISVDVRPKDYILQNYFARRMSVGNRLSEQVDGENFRAVSLPVDETNSLSRSILVGDTIDILFTFNVPMVGSKMSVMFLQNVPVIATGMYSAADQEIGDRGGKPKSYSSLTLKLSAEDAMRLNYARQVGKISLLLRNVADSNYIDLAPIQGIADLLSAADKSKVENLAKQTTLKPDEKIQAQMKEVLRLQKQQAARARK